MVRRKAIVVPGRLAVPARAGVAMAWFLAFSAPAFSADARITGPKKKLDAQIEALNAVSQKCRPNSKDISDISGSLTAGNITNAVAIAGGGTAMVTSGISVFKEFQYKGLQKKDELTDEEKKKMEKTTDAQGKLRLASAIGSGVATAGNTVSTLTLNSAAGKLDKALEYYGGCFDALEAVDTTGW
ncbi:MAG: hypothetical protein LBT92_00940 [Rickettsiales bacterium]|jgi:hypothetical protein|nr:hypothetical protein [Rickettsiales bacterium]